MYISVEEINSVDMSLIPYGFLYNTKVNQLNNIIWDDLGRFGTCTKHYLLVFPISNKLILILLE